MWIHNSDKPFGVLTSDEMDALVIDVGDTESSENRIWMGNRTGNVVRV